ncbi:MAG: SDR family oxidoreductase [Gammaproteobacteria bacterium]|nr:SDR family oxidoreductase [Gammaproteobacteria bacterium]
MKKSKLDFRDKTAVITGAGSGIGRALAQSLATRGCHLALVDINTDSLAETATLVRPSGVRLSTHTLDVASREQVAGFPAQVLRDHPTIDLLFNNAGVAVGGHFLETTEADFDWLFEINFHGVVRMTRAFLPMLLARPDAHIINTASIFGVIAPAGQTHYSASKFAVRGFSHSLYAELREFGIKVSCVYPGSVSTNFFDLIPGIEPNEHMLRSEDVANLLRELLETSPNFLTVDVEIRPLKPGGGRK